MTALPDRTAHRAGRFIVQTGGYRAFIPLALPPEPGLIVDEDMQVLLCEAERNLGRLDSLAQFIPDPDRFVYLYIRREAVLSSQIEGTQASLSDLLEFEAQGASESKDVRDVANYVRALQDGLEMARKLPISSRLLCQVHQILMSGVRGGDRSKTPGEFRKTQNWIGGATPGSAIFVPPPPDAMQRAMGELEKYLNADKRTPLLIEIGLAHAQFETIHPFLDGNGRMGRLLVTFMLSLRGVLRRPLLYISHYFKQFRAEYYARLQAVRTEGDWENWIRFFLRAVASVAEEAARRANKIIELIAIDRELIRTRLPKSEASALKLHDALIERPIATPSALQARSELSQPTVDSLLKRFEKLEIVKETSGRRRDRIFSYFNYLRLFDGD